MTTTMMKKIEEAQKMVAYFVEHKLIDGGADRFTPTEYDQMRWQWEGETPAWSTLKKYATEAGLTSTRTLPCPSPRCIFIIARRPEFVNTFYKKFLDIFFEKSVDNRHKV